MNEYVLTRDLVIPAGTVFSEAPVKTERFTDHIEAVVPLGKDSAISIILPVENNYHPFEKNFTRLIR